MPRKLVDSCARRLTAALAVSHGNYSEDGGLPYRSGAMIPEDRGQPVAIEHLPTACRVPAYPGGFVGLMDLDPSAVTKLRAPAPQVAAGCEHASGLSGRIVRDALTPVFAMAGSAYTRVSKSRARLRTITVDQRRNHRIGLHLDNLENAPFHERRFARNRISINLGEDVRWLLFMDTPIELVFRALGLVPSDGCNPVDQAFYASSRNRLHVYSLAVYPGEAYIAPTECLVHDASTLEGYASDCSLTIRVQTVPSPSLRLTEVH